MTDEEKIEALAEVCLMAGLQTNPLHGPGMRRTTTTEIDAIRQASRDTRLRYAKALLDEIKSWPGTL